MGNLKEIRTRIGSVKSTQQITRAMKMVSASKFRKAQDAILKIRPYANKINEVIIPIAEGMEDLSFNPYFQEREVKRVLVIPITSDKGLCGSFNSTVIREAVNLINSYEASVDLICFGKKSFDFFSRSKKGYNIIEKYFDLTSNISFSEIEEVANRILKSFADKEYDEIRFVYNAFTNPAVYTTTNTKFLPLESIVEQDLQSDQAKHMNHNFIFEPSENEIINELIPTSLKIKFFRSLLESNASEHGARMTAMDKATENAEELLGELKLKYNKERQATITKEILEIVGGTTA
ncbi:MAG: ATP synthase F1 subunit gamma [Bacteroidetes bacterium]|nr:ATP synthase F1 subunit gamma [Bacteroidota bacterium]MBT7038467.1 ATP synthase F1 subunit gamma [Bacteroidota bacterium]